MDRSQKVAISNLQAEFDVSIQLKKDHIIIEGNHVDVGTVYEEIQKIFRKMEEQEKKNFEDALLAKTVQWKYIDQKEVHHDYPIHINSYIEKAYQKDTTRRVIWKDEWGVGDTIVFDFSQMEAVKNNDRRFPFPITRIDLTKNTDTEFPQSWGQVNEDDDLSVEDLKSNNLEYQQIETSFKADFQSSGTQINQIVSIKQVRNPFLYKQYGVKKMSIRRQCLSQVKMERNLWHEVKANMVMEINRHGFDRSKSGKTGDFGKGLYFLRNSFDSDFTPDANSNRLVYRAKVITGEYTKGNNVMIDPPSKGASDATIKYHSTVDDTQNPGVFVIFADNQAYPEYLIEYN